MRVTTAPERYWKRRYKRLVRTINTTGGVAKVKMQRPDGTWAFGVFLPFSDRDVMLKPTSRLAPRRGRDGTTADGERRP